MTPAPASMSELCSQEPEARTGEFESFVADVRSKVEARLADWLKGRIGEAHRRGMDVGAVADAVADLALRGGKRLRPVLLCASFEACGGRNEPEALAQAGVALELLQVYLLIHDDWMDKDEMRRGGPSVPAMLRARFEPRLVDSMCVLAGDLAAAWARRALLEVALPPSCVMLAAGELAGVEEQVVQGQVLDVCGAPRSRAEVEAMHALKTASYSVRGPVVMGARLAGATAVQVDDLAAFAEPLGIAFQLRDDLLGVFGDASKMGKPAGADLLGGKRSAVVIEAAQDVLVDEPFARVFGRSDASRGDVDRVIASLNASGAPARIEARIGVLVGLANAALERATLTSRGRGLLARAVEALTHRQC